jgi:CRISPR/Cas system-associated endoribonuclease Cas2
MIRNEFYAKQRRIFACELMEDNGILQVNDLDLAGMNSSIINRDQLIIIIYTLKKTSKVEKSFEGKKLI